MDWMVCEEYRQLLSARLDGELSPQEEKALEEHLAVCPACRADEAQLAAIQAAFKQLEDVEVPEGFAQSVMERVRAEKKAIPLYKRPQLKAVAGLVACLALVAGLYQASRFSDLVGTTLVAREFRQETPCEYSDAPMIAAYSASCELTDSDESIAARSVQRSAPDATADDAPVEPPSAAVITFERLPEGWEELFPGVASPDAMQVSAEEARAFLQLLVEQDITSAMSGRLDENGTCQLLLARP